MFGPEIFGEAFAKLFIVLLLIGTALGLVVAGLIWLLIYLCQHIDIRWIP